MKTNNFLAFAVTAALLTACTNDEPGIDINDRTPLSINAGITTRAIDNVWTAGDAIGVMMYEAGTTNFVDGKGDLCYFTANADGAFAPTDEANTAYFPKQEAPTDITAYYPYVAGVTTTLAINTTNQADLSKIDFMLADKLTGLTEKTPAVNFQFRHQLAKLVISVTPDASAASVDLTGATLVVKGTASTATYTFATDKLTADATANIAIPVALKDGVITAKGIVVPTAAGSGVALELTTQAGKVFTAPLSTTTELKAGTVNTLRMSLGLTESKVTATIAPWEGGVEVSLTSLSMSITAPDGTDPGFADMQLWTAAAPDAKATYTNTAGVWSSSTPFYLETLTDADSFYALHTPADKQKDVVTGFKDILGAGPATVAEGGVALTFTHLMSHLTVRLVAGTNLPVDVTAATLALKGFNTAITMDGTTLTSGTPGDFAPTVTQAEAGILVAPQTFASGTKPVIVTIGSNTYTLTLNQEMKLEAGKKNILTLTLNPSEVQATVAVTDWIAESINHAITIDGITTGTGVDGTGAVGDVLTLTGKQGSAAAVSATYTAALAADGSSSILWNAATPLYWNDFTVGTVPTFTAFFTPAAAGNPEKDYLKGSTTPATFGGAIDFSTSDNKLTHLMSRVKLVLENIAPTDGVSTAFTQAEFDAITASFTLKKSSAVTYDGITLNSTAEAIALAPERIYNTGVGTKNGIFHTLAPQALADANLITLIYPTGEGNETRTVTIKPSDITVGTGKLTAFDAGKQYTLTIKVTKMDKVKISVSVSVKDWETINGGGDVEL